MILKNMETLRCPFLVRIRSLLVFLSLIAGAADSLVDCAGDGGFSLDRRLGSAIQNQAGRRGSTRLQAWESLGTPVDGGPCSSAEYRMVSGFVGGLIGIYGDPLDLNVDGFANWDDFYVYVNGWHRTRGEEGFRTRADLNGNLRIEEEDLTRFIQSAGRLK